MKEIELRVILKDVPDGIAAGDVSKVIRQILANQHLKFTDLTGYVQKIANRTPPAELYNLRMVSVHAFNKVPEVYVQDVTFKE